jgi:hypothetical protein
MSAQKLRVRRLRAGVGDPDRGAVSEHDTRDVDGVRERVLAQQRIVAGDRPTVADAVLEQMGDGLPEMPVRRGLQDLGVESHERGREPTGHVERPLQQATGSHADDVSGAGNRRHVVGSRSPGTTLRSP